MLVTIFEKKSNVSNQVKCHNTEKDKTPHCVAFLVEYPLYIFAYTSEGLKERGPLILLAYQCPLS